ncbi:MAG: Hpt domain-containing protein [Chitinophagales bacterium]|nr:Hpt domain-containing protein [Chitinophagales bacterium]
METKQVVDFSTLKEFTGNDENLMKIHINTFIQFAPAQLQKLRQKLNEQNWIDLGNEAHKLKPKCTYMGIKEAESLFKTIELNAKEQKDLEKLPELVAIAENTINQAIAELKAFVNS